MLGYAPFCDIGKGFACAGKNAKAEVEQARKWQAQTVARSKELKVSFEREAVIAIESS